ncbi:MAG: hypothetical protein WC879_03600 [Melioribacteraceae bacterium]
MLSPIEIGNNLRSFAKEKKYSLAELGRLLGMKQQAFKKYYEGERTPGGNILSKLSDLGCDLNWLLNGENSSIILKEPNETAMDYKIKTLEERITKLESKLFQLTEENETLKEDNKLLKHNLAKNIDDSKIQRNNIH